MSHLRAHWLRGRRGWIACTAAAVVLCGGVGVWRLVTAARTAAARTRDL